MNPIGKSKIARLPETVRAELNRRLADGAGGRALAAWLNGLPEVRAVLDQFFAGRPISQQNVSQWCQTGFADWRIERDLRAQPGGLSWNNVTAALEALRLDPAAKHDVQGRLNGLCGHLAEKYALEFAQVNAVKGTDRLRLLTRLTRDMDRLRRANHASIRLDLARERLDLRSATALAPCPPIRPAAGHGNHHTRHGSPVNGVAFPARMPSAAAGLAADMGISTEKFPDRMVAEGQDFETVLDRLIEQWVDLPVGEDGHMDPSELARQTSAADQTALARAFPGQDLPEIFRRIAEGWSQDDGLAPDGEHGQPTAAMAATGVGPEKPPGGAGLSPEVIAQISAAAVARAVAELQEEDAASGNPGLPRNLVPHPAAPPPSADVLATIEYVRSNVTAAQTPAAPGRKVFSSDPLQAAAQLQALLKRLASEWVDAQFSGKDAEKLLTPDGEVDEAALQARRDQWDLSGIFRVVLDQLAVSLAPVTPSPVPATVANCPSAMLSEVEASPASAFPHPLPINPGASQ